MTIRMQVTADVTNGIADSAPSWCVTEDFHRGSGIEPHRIGADTIFDVRASLRNLPNAQRLRPNSRALNWLIAPAPATP